MCILMMRIRSCSCVICLRCTHDHFKKTLLYERDSLSKLEWVRQEVWCLMLDMTLKQDVDHLPMITHWSKTCLGFMFLKLSNKKDITSYYFNILLRIKKPLYLLTSWPRLYIFAYSLIIKTLIDNLT